MTLLHYGSSSSKDPNKQALAKIKSKLTDHQFDFIKMKMDAQDKKVMMIFKCFNINKDEDDLLDSLKRVYYDPWLKIIGEVNSRVTKEVADFIKAKVMAGDKKVISMFKCYDQTKD